MKKNKSLHAPTIVIDKNGLQGTAAGSESLSSVAPADPERRLLVHFQNGQQVLIPSEMLVRHEDGSYHLPVSIEDLMAMQESGGSEDGFRYNADAEMAKNGMARDATDINTQERVLPVIHEEVKVQRRLRETGVVEIHKTVHERTETVDQPLQSEEVQIERVPINRIVETPVSVRQEGDTLIIPLLEEVLVVEKRLMLREEVHVKKLRKEVHDPQEVLLREERVEVSRRAGASSDDQPQNNRTDGKQ